MFSVFRYLFYQIGLTVDQQAAIPTRNSLQYLCEFYKPRPVAYAGISKTPCLNYRISGEVALGRTHQDNIILTQLLCCGGKKSWSRALFGSPMAIAIYNLEIATRATSSLALDRQDTFACAVVARSSAVQAYFHPVI